MPLHEYLEKKRRENIAQLNATGACHICGSTCRNSQGFSRFMCNENKANFVDGILGEKSNRDDRYAEPSVAQMRTCGCFGIPPTDPYQWPYSLRVCEMCIADDVSTGRIRHCGVCGAVACDENCGVELVECTDQQEWNNAGEFAGFV